MNHRRIVLALAVATSMSALAACSDSDGDATPTSVTQVGVAETTAAPADNPTESTEAPTAEAPKVATVVAASVHEPTMLLERPGDDGYLWIAERAGRVRRAKVDDDGQTLSVTGDDVLDISAQTTTDAERGLLGMAFSADGDTLYVSYTDPDGNSRVVGYPIDGTTVDASAPDVLFRVDQPYPNHNGGHIVLGPDGKLWLGLGDGGAADDPENRAQDPSTPLGKVLRIDLDTKATDIVITGVRNPWRYAFDIDGSLWIADVGQNAIEEIDYLPADQIDGANLGWSGYEGTAEYLEGDGRRPADAIPPVFEYRHEAGNCSITGGFVYQGTAIAGLQGAYLFADYCAGDLRAVTVNSDGTLAQEYDLGVTLEQPVSFAAGPDGEPYVLLGGGNIVRLLPG